MLPLIQSEKNYTATVPTDTAWYNKSEQLSSKHTRISNSQTDAIYQREAKKTELGTTKGIVFLYKKQCSLNKIEGLGTIIRILWGLSNLQAPIQA